MTQTQRTFLIFGCGFLLLQWLNVVNALFNLFGFVETSTTPAAFAGIFLVAGWAAIIYLFRKHVYNA